LGEHDLGLGEQAQVLLVGPRRGGGRAATPATAAAPSKILNVPSMGVRPRLA
jgi:hypothetical protein